MSAVRIAVGLACLGIASVAALPGQAHAAPSVRTQAHRLLVASTTTATGPGYAVLVARGDQVLVREAVGLANLELQVPLSPEQVFLIGSNTKLFTAVTVLKYAEAGRLSLGDPISRYLPDYPNGEHISIHQLLNHTSGIRDFTSLPETGDKRDFSTADLIALFRDQPVDFPPGADFRYDNSGYVLLGAIIEKISGKSWHAAIHDAVIEPLGLTRTGYSETEPLYPGRSAGYSHDQDGHVVNVESTNTSGAGAAGGLASTLDELYRFLRALHGGKILSAQSYQTLVTPVPAASGEPREYGYGLIHLRLRGVDGEWHSGNVAGFASAQAYFAKPKITVIVFANSDTPETSPVLLMQKLAAIALRKPFPERKPVTLGERQLHDVEGVYRIDATHLRRISIVDGQLSVQRSNGGPPSTLLAASPEEFFLPDRLAWFHAVRDAHGAVAALDLFDGSDDPPLRELRTDAAFPSPLSAH